MKHGVIRGLMSHVIPLFSTVSCWLLFCVVAKIMSWTFCSGMFVQTYRITRLFCLIRFRCEYEIHVNPYEQNIPKFMRISVFLFGIIVHLQNGFNILKSAMFTSSMVVRAAASFVKSWITLDPDSENKSLRLGSGHKMKFFTFTSKNKLTKNRPLSDLALISSVYMCMKRNVPNSDFSHLVYF